MKRNPVIRLLIAGLLIFSLTGQAAAAFRMACEDTSACCCKPMPAMADIAADRALTGGGCCTTSQSQPCDLAGPVSSPSAPFLPTEINSKPEITPALSSAAVTSASVLNGGASRGVPIKPPLLADPPIYLQTQTFLC